MEISDGQPRKRSNGAEEFTRRVKVTSEAQPVAVALIEAKAENLPPGHGMEQAKLYAECRVKAVECAVCDRHVMA